MIIFFSLIWITILKLFEFNKYEFESEFIKILSKIFEFKATFIALSNIVELLIYLCFIFYP